MRHDFADGKYTVINDNGRLTALRHGESWGRDLVGDNLVYWMLVEVNDLKTQRDALLEVLKDAAEAFEGASNGEVINFYYYAKSLRTAIKMAEENQ